MVLKVLCVTQKTRMQMHVLWLIAYATELTYSSADPQSKSKSTVLAKLTATGIKKVGQKWAEA